MPYGDTLPAPMYGQVRVTARDNYCGGDQRISLANGGEVYTVPSLPSLTELGRLGLYTARIATANAFTHVAAMPTTRAELLLYNGDPKKTYVITAVWHVGITSMAAAGSVAPIGQLVVGIAAPTDNTAVPILSANGCSYGGFAKRAIAQTTMVADRWDVLASSNSGGGATAQIGLAVFADCYGKYLVRPGSTFGVNVIAGTAAGTALMGIQWAEVDLSY